MRKLVLIASVVGLATVAGCGGAGGTSAPASTANAAPATQPAPTTAAGSTTVGGPATTANSCAKDSLPLKTAGQLTIGTGNPAYTPWFEGGETGNEWKGNDPANDKGYESAFAYALAEQLGCTADEVKWIPSSFDQSIAPGPKKWDFNLQQISYSNKRAERVGLSVSYYDVNQALVSYKGSKIADATTFADLKNAKLAAPAGTTSYDYITQNIKPDVQPAVYDDLATAVKALDNHQVDGIVADFPTAYYIANFEVKKGTLVGQFPTVGQQEYFSLATDKNSPLLPCLNSAIQALRANGTLDQIRNQWLSQAISAPVISG